MEIQPQRNNINLEIEQLYGKIDALKDDTTNKEKELSEARISLKEKNESLSNAINNIYSTRQIKNSFDVFFTSGDALYKKIYNIPVVFGQDAKKMFFAEIKNKPLSEIVMSDSLIFKHKIFWRKMMNWFFVLFLSFIFAIFILGGNKYGRDYHDDVTFLGFVLYGAGGLFALMAFAAKTQISVVKNKEIVTLIQNEKEEEFINIMEYLNSIHKLPDLIKKQIEI